jgi:large subunit ribosomal protein L28
VPEAASFVSMNLTTRDIHSIDKIGAIENAKRHGVNLNRL